MIQFGLYNIFQMGWFNHQPDKIFTYYIYIYCKTPVKTKSTVCCQFPTSSVTSSFFPRSKTKRQVHHVEESALQTRWKPQASPQTKWLKLSHTTPSTGPPEPNSYFGITWCFPFWNNMWYPWMQIHTPKKLSNFLLLCQKSSVRKHSRQ